jgi:hypothetical protein
MLYSFWKIRESALGFTLPWQLVAAQPPGPTYFEDSVEVLAGRRDAAEESPSIGAAAEKTETAAASKIKRNTERRTSGCLPSKRFFIQLSATVRRARRKNGRGRAARSSFAYTLRSGRSQRGRREDRRAGYLFRGPEINSGIARRPAPRGLLYRFALVLVGAVRPPRSFSERREPGIDL